MRGKCYFVATPIGNLSDITLRALDTLKNCDIIACEDTRHSLKLLNHFEIKKPLMSFHKFNEATAAEGIISKLDEGKSVAVVSDAGMPCISDPGSVLVKILSERGYEYSVIPGASAVVTAAALCGVEGAFCFIGFLHDKKKERIKQLEPFIGIPASLIFYVAPHDLNKTLDFLFSELGDRGVSVVKEITKIHEAVIKGKLSDLRFDEPKGEFVLVVAPPEAVQEREPSDEEIFEALELAIKAGMDRKLAVSSVCEGLKLNKNRVYKLSLKL